MSHSVDVEQHCLDNYDFTSFIARLQITSHAYLQLVVRTWHVVALNYSLIIHTEYVRSTDNNLYNYLYEKSTFQLTSMMLAPITTATSGNILCLVKLANSIYGHTCLVVHPVTTYAVKHAQWQHSIYDQTHPVATFHIWSNIPSGNIPYMIKHTQWQHSIYRRLWLISAYAYKCKW